MTKYNSFTYCRLASFVDILQLQNWAFNTSSSMIFILYHIAIPLIVLCVKYCNPVQFRTWNLYLIQTSFKFLDTTQLRYNAIRSIAQRGRNFCVVIFART